MKKQLLVKENNKIKYEIQRGAETSAFGTPGRINHDSTKFYQSRLYEGISVKYDPEYKEVKIKEALQDKIYCKSSERMSDIPDNSVHLMITSPPYNVTNGYFSRDV